MSSFSSATLTFSDVKYRMGYQTATSQRKEKRAHRAVSTTLWAGFRGRNLNSYIFHIPWKEVVKSSPWYSDKEIIDFPMTYRKLHIFKKVNNIRCPVGSQDTTWGLPSGYRFRVVSSTFCIESDTYSL